MQEGKLLRGKKKKKQQVSRYNETSINAKARIAFNAEERGGERRHAAPRRAASPAISLLLCHTLTTKDAPLRIIDFHRERRNVREFQRTIGGNESIVPERSCGQIKSMFARTPYAQPFRNLSRCAINPGDSVCVQSTESSIT